MAKPYLYDYDIYVGGPKLPNWRLRLLVRDYLKQGISWKEPALFTHVTVCLLVPAYLWPHPIWILVAGCLLISVSSTCFKDSNSLKWLAALIAGIMLISPVRIPPIIAVLIIMAVGTIATWGLVLVSWRVARKQSHLRRWSEDPALVLLNRSFTNKGGSRNWLRQEASKHGDITNMIDAYLEASSLSVAEFPKSWRVLPISKSMPKLGRSALELVIKAANELVDYIMPTYHEHLDAANKAKEQQHLREQTEAAAQKARQDFLAEQEARLNQQRLQMAKDDVNTFIEGLPFQRHQGSHHS